MFSQRAKKIRRLQKVVDFRSRRILGVPLIINREDDDELDFAEEESSESLPEDVEETSTTSVDETEAAPVSNNHANSDDANSDDDNDEVNNNYVSEVDMIPMVPDPNWLDEHGWEYVGFRIPRAGELFVTKNLDLKVAKADESMNEIWDCKRWVIRPKRQAKGEAPMNSQSAQTRQDIIPEPSVPDVIL